MGARAQARPAPPQLAREPAELPDGSQVFVRALRLTERLTIRRQVAELTAGKGLEESLVLLVPRLLAVTVVDEADVPVFTAEQWDDYGAAHPAQTLELFNTASKLSGFDREAAEKNS